MNPWSPEVADFLATADKVATGFADTSDSPSSIRGTLEETGLLDLASEIVEESDELVWLAHTVRVAAQSAPSLASALAGRYAADAVGRECGTNGSTFALSFDGAAAVASEALAPERAVVWDAASNSILVAPWSSVSIDASQPRSGLHRAELVSVSMPTDVTRSNANPSEVIARWDLLTGAALVGLARRAVQETQSYVMGRSQFGVPIGSFTGLRAIVAGMDLAVDEAEALLIRAVDGGTSSATVSATAGRVAVAVCIDAIQAHGGYGYIDEYPLAGLLRDAISIQARSGGRRFHIARLAQRGLGPQGSVLP
ncbi:acyl-CoA dehydrogenase family protein [Rhodococcoides fascians]|uniref:acyl-CoA dehydrogenase family protein n=1 Tax=Rhodococcoides fascians TaxID=1828 RepID=UPI000522E9CB|nr:acyl-CoA dehydrogenase family protein [Rhodococcus fascians]